MGQNPQVFRSVSTDQSEILNSIIKLYCPEGFHLDATYGNGSFYKNGVPKPKLRFDLDESLEDCEYGDSTNLPLESASINSVVFDPPFLTYVRQNRSGNGNMVMSNRFSGYWRYSELEKHYRDSMKEFSRLLVGKGIVVFKCQDIIHNHRIHPTHVSVINWCPEFDFRLKDLFILTASHRMPSPNRKGQQRHARIFHSYFLVLEKR